MKDKLISALTKILVFLLVAGFSFLVFVMVIGSLGSIIPDGFLSTILMLAAFVVPVILGFWVTSIIHRSEDEAYATQEQDLDEDINDLINKEDSVFTVIKEEISCWNWQLVAGGLIFCWGLWNIFSSFFFAIVLIVLGLGFLSVGNTKYNEKKELQERALKRRIMAAMAKNSPAEGKTEPAPAPRPQPVQDHTPVEEKAEPAPTSKPIEKQKFDYASLKSKTYKLAGVTQYVDNIKSIGTENEDYFKSQRELIAEDMIDERIWRYEFPRRRALLKPEPDNPVDPKAIKVFVDCEHVGYIKSGSCAHVHKLLDNHAIAEIICTIGGGPYKCITEEYDEDAEEDVYVLEKGEINFFVHLEIVEKFDVS